MLFDFQKYVQPIWYFNLNPEVDSDFSNSAKVEGDERFSTELGKRNHRKWRSLINGYELKKTKSLSKDRTVIDLYENYIFVRTNFHSFWCFYIFLLRLFTFHNPINETLAIKNSLKFKKISLDIEKENYLKINGLGSFPSVSIIIPTLNRYQYLKDVLHDLEKQSIKNFEVIVVDQSNPFEEDFYQGFNLDLKILNQTKPLLWKARNTAIKKAKGELILLFDDDSRVKSDWIESHITALEYFDADLSSGISLSKVGDRIPTNYKNFRLSDQLDTGNVLVKREVFEAIGLFDEQFEKQRMGDAEFGLRSYLTGFKNISNPLAKRIHLKVSTGGLRQMGHWDAFRPKKLYSPRPIPSVLYYSRKYFGDANARYWLIKSIPPSLIPFKWKKNRVLSFLAYFSFIFLWPLYLFQIFRSWKLSSAMLKAGAQIPTLEKSSINQF